MYAHGIYLKARIIETSRELWRSVKQTPDWRVYTYQPLQLPKKRLVLIPLAETLLYVF